MTIQEKAIEQLERISNSLASIGETVDYTDIAIQALEREPIEDCISREAVKEMLTTEWTKYMPMESDVNLSFVLEKISELPSVTPKARWIKLGKNMFINLENAREQYRVLGYPHRNELKLQCSECRMVTMVDESIAYNYCPHCGAKMEVENG